MTDFLDMCFAGVSIRPITMSLVEHLMLGEPLTPDEVIHFGVDTQLHYQVLQAIVQDACGEEADLDDELTCGFILLEMHRVLVELDRAIGDSAKLNALVHTHEPGYVGRVQFHTTRDRLLAGHDTATNVAHRQVTAAQF
jgi:hypothetical protein